MITLIVLAAPWTNSHNPSPGKPQQKRVATIYRLPQQTAQQIGGGRDSKPREQRAITKLDEGGRLKTSR